MSWEPFRPAWAKCAESRDAWKSQATWNVRALPIGFIMPWSWQFAVKVVGPYVIFRLGPLGFVWKREAQ